MTIIFHITTHADWERAEREGVYRATSLDTQGFIHFSTAAQVVDTANRFYSGQRDLLLLMVDTARLQMDLRYEPPADSPESAERFPHLYGTLNLNAVLQVVAFPPDADGSWSELPADLDDLDAEMES